MDPGIRIPTENQIGGVWTTKVPAGNWIRGQYPNLLVKATEKWIPVYMVSVVNFIQV